MAQVRRLGQGDLEAFRAMNALFADVFEMPREYGDAKPGDAYVASWLENPANIAVVAEDSGQVVGAIGGYELQKFEQERSEIFIYDLAVAQSHRRQGIASAMIEAIRAIARERGARTVFVQADTAAEDAPAQALYRKFASEEITALHFDISP